MLGTMCFLLPDQFLIQAERHLWEVSFQLYS